jgi:spermidine synthase
MSASKPNPLPQRPRMRRVNADSSQQEDRESISVEDDGLVTLGGLTVDQDTLVRVLKPAGAAPAVLCRQLRADSYDKPFLIEDGKYRAMYFSINGSTQSEMRIDDPDALVNGYTRKMMAFLLFRPRPQHILMIGLGGGSLVKYCRRHLQSTRVTAVEIDASVLALRSHFRIPADGPDLRVVHADGARYVADLAGSGETTDVLLVDAYDHGGIARSVADLAFLENAHRVLTDRGVFVMNFAVRESDYATHVRMIQAVFGEPVIPVSVGWGGNIVVFAGPALRDRRCLAAAAGRARRLQERLDLSFPRLPGLVSDYLHRTPPARAGGGMD